MNDKPLQFGIRHVLGVMLLVAFLSALVAPWVRGWSAGQWLTLGLQSGCIFGSFALGIGFQEWARNRKRRSLGELRFEVKCRIWGQSGWSPATASTTLLLAVIIIVFLMAGTVLSGSGRDFYDLLPQNVFVGLMAAAGAGQLRFPPDRMLIGQHGVRTSEKILSWDVLWCSYAPEEPPAPILLKTPGRAYLVYPPADVEAAVGEYLQQRVQRWENPAPRRRF